MIQKKWFHATTLEALPSILSLGLIPNEDNELYLARNYDELIRFINLPVFKDLRKCKVVLSVKYVPSISNPDKYWELVANESISPDNLKVHKYL